MQQVSIMLDLDDDLAFTTAYQVEIWSMQHKKHKHFRLKMPDFICALLSIYRKNSLSVPECANSVIVLQVLRFYKQPLMPQSRLVSASRRGTYGTAFRAWAACLCSKQNLA